LRETNIRDSLWQTDPDSASLPPSMNTDTLTPILRGPVPLSHLLLQRYVQPGDRTVDATCGNGNDTLLLARLTGPVGRVWAFDIQAAALERTAQALSEAGLQNRVALVAAGHETMGDHVVGPLTAAVFNLGYLPGGDRTVITQPDSTLAALGQALKLLAPGGIIAVTVYPGHPGGAAERTVVEEWCASLPPGTAHVWHMGQFNVAADAPYLILIQKGA
jgi:SAM-dependent methyltransferase